MGEKPNQEKGITLIALVLTIIVLIILAAVSVATLTGDNGILTKAQEAKETTKKAEIEEQLKLAQLSAKIKKEGGAITVSDLLQELESQGVDFERGEDGNSIIIDGKYVIEIQEKDGELKFEDQGTVSKPRPKVVSIDIIEKTETSIQVEVIVNWRNEGGKLRYYIKEENAEDYDLVKEQEGQEFTFENLDPNKTYSKIKVEAIAPNGETAYLEKEISNVPSLATEGAVTLSYRANGQVIEENTWTKGPVTVTVKVNSAINMQGYTLQTAQSTGIERTGEINWQETPSQIFTTKGTIYARIIDKTNGSKGKEYTKGIDKIDTTAPTINMDETQKSVTATTNSITIRASATDGESGIAKYSFSRDNGVNWEWKPTEGLEEGQAEASYTFNNLPQTQTYNLKIKVTDQVGNEAISETIIKDTGTVPAGTANIEFSYSNANWTNGNVGVTISKKAGNEAYKLQYSKDGGTWTDYTGKITFEVNGRVDARLTDNKTAGHTGNIGAIATGNVLKIDKTAPTISTEMPLQATNITTNSMELKIKVQDKKPTNASLTDTVSGLSKIKWFYKKSTETNYTSTEDIYQAMNGAKAGATTEQEKTKTVRELTAGTTYNIYAEIYDVAGNITRAPATGTVNPKTKNIYTVNYDAWGGVGAPSSQMKIEGEDLTLSTQKPTKAGYAFETWHIAPVSESPSYRPGSVYKEDKNMTLYAAYEKGTIYFSAGDSATVTSPQTEGDSINSWKSEITVSEESDISYTVTNSTATYWCAFYVFCDDREVECNFNSGTYKTTVPANSKVRFELHSTGNSSTKERTITGKIDSIVGKQTGTTYTKKVSPIVTSKGAILHLQSPSETVYKGKSVISSFIVPEDCNVRFSAKGSNTVGGDRQTYLNVDGVDVANMTGSLTKDYRTCHIMKNSKVSLRVGVGGDANKTAEQYGEIESITGVWSGISYRIE